jgi:type IV pilus assembly protein PilB
MQEPLKMAGDDAPAVLYLQKILEQAAQMLASDVHVEPYEHQLRIRVRVDGVLREIDTPPLPLKDRLASRIKVLSRLDIAEKRLPQDGRMKLNLPSGKELDLRVSTLPTLHGEKLVLRLLDNHHAMQPLDSLGYEPEQLQKLREAIAQPEGLVLVTGPTGAGKTQSLYACLHQLNREGVNISTVEDPCEIPMPGINQVNVQDKPGLDFATVLRAFLRQDPDILMVGEIRDLETAHIAIQAAQTGHLVLSTLHTNDAPSTLARLMNMGVASYNVAASVKLVTAQRLVRKLCPACRKPTTWTPQEWEQWGGQRQPHPFTGFNAHAQGCTQCHQGYRGRTGIFEVMPVQGALRDLLLAQASASALAQQARHDGVLSLRQAGLRKVMQGITSLQEVMSNTQELA